MCVCVCRCVTAVRSCTFTFSNTQLQVNILTTWLSAQINPATITANKIDMHARCLNTGCIYKHTPTRSFPRRAVMKSSGCHCYKCRDLASMEKKSKGLHHAKAGKQESSD